MRTLAKFLALSAAAGLLAVSPLTATILKQMNLEDLTGNANRIFSGTVIEVDKGSIEVGGGTLSTVTYRVLVDTAFRGDFLDKGGQKVADFRMVTNPGPTRSGDLMRFSVLPEMPEIEMGKRYLFFTTAPSTVGLSTTVGLGQGCFRISGEPGEELLVNEFDNLGLFRGMSVTAMPERGPIAYTSLTEQINALLGGK
jgi:hypothetical protein